MGPQGQHITIVAQEKVVNVSDLSVGDRVAAEYLASLHGEVRGPTEEELALWTHKSDLFCCKVYC